MPPRPSVRSSSNRQHNNFVYNQNMDYPAYKEFTARFGEGPESYLERLSTPQLLCISRELEIAFQPPFDAQTPEAELRAAIIEAAVADFQKEGEDVEIVRAVEKCVTQGT